MAYKDKDELLDALYDHIYGDQEPEEGDDFFDHLASFFDQFDQKNDDSSGNNDGQHRRRQRRNSNQSSRSNPPRRKQRAATQSGYGSTAFFGTGN